MCLYIYCIPITQKGIKDQRKLYHLISISSNCLIQIVIKLFIHFNEKMKIKKKLLFECLHIRCELNI